MTYTHHVPGRLRIRSAAIKGSPRAAETLRNWLEARPGVQSVHTNLLTGSVLIHYAPAVTDGTALAAELRRQNWVASYPQPAARLPRTLPPAVAKRQLARRPQAAPDVTSLVAKAVLSYAVEAAVSRSVGALVAAIL